MRRLSRLVLLMTFALALAWPGPTRANEPLPMPDKVPVTVPLPAPDPSAAPPGRMSTEQRFQAANTTQDGRLTLPQAQQGYKSIVRHFETIDSTGKGFVTLDDIRAWQKSTREARQAVRAALDDPLRPRAAMQRLPASGPAVKDMAESTEPLANATRDDQDPD